MYEVSKDQMNEFVKAYYDALVETISGEAEYIMLNSIAQRLLNHANVFFENGVQIDETELDTILNSSTDFKHNSQKTLEFMKALMKGLVTSNERFEFNDVADFYLDYIAEGLDVPFITSEQRWKRLAGK